VNLINLFETISPPGDNGNAFSVAGIPLFPNFKVGCDSDMNPVLLITVSRQHGRVLRNFRFKYLQLLQDVECRIREDVAEPVTQTFTIVKFTSSDRYLRHYFLRVSETLVKSLGASPSHDETVAAINTFVEVFKFLSDQPTGTVQGLWSELFVINISSNTEVLVDSWHNAVDDTFDFAGGHERIEVKSTSTQDRVHFFSSSQLNPENGIEVLIVSVFTRQSTKGISIQDLADQIGSKLNSPDLKMKLELIISRTLGDSLEQALDIKFDDSLARTSVKFFSHKAVARIESINIPNQVSNVSFKSDLTFVPEANLAELQSRTISQYLN
jgi:hypothetical protein